eukprot:COSAG02_NODE_42712_length_382_cov_0.593640_1_plen_38_part_10
MQTVPYGDRAASSALSARALQVTGKNCRPYGDTNRMVH